MSSPNPSPSPKKRSAPVTPLSSEQQSLISAKKQAALEKLASKKQKTEHDNNNNNSNSINSHNNNLDEKSSVQPITIDILENSFPVGWSALAPEFSKAYFKSLKQSIGKEIKSGKRVFPPLNQVFRAFQCVNSVSNIKVVILGQDPYFNDNQAEGLCFSVRHGVQVPPSLKNIYKELADDIPNFKIPNHGSLVHWANQGVLLLNTVLTVNGGSANSHKDFGWIQFTDAVIEYINKNTVGVVFLLWGQPAQKKGAKLDKTKHFVLTAGHPSPLSVKSFLKCKHFSKCNDLLVRQGKNPIDWQV